MLHWYGSSLPKHEKTGVKREKSRVEVVISFASVAEHEKIIERGFDEVSAAHGKPDELLGDKLKQKQ